MTYLLTTFSFGDRVGTPGTDMTFFDWPHIGPAIPGTVFRVSNQEALLFWQEQLESSPANNVNLTAIGELQLLIFQDPESQQLYLTNDQGAEFKGEPWLRQDIPEEFLLRGFFSVILSTPHLIQLEEILTSGLNFGSTEKRGVKSGKS